MADLDAIYREYGRLVYGYLLTLCRDSHLAEELTQETMFRAVMNIGAFRGDCQLSVWLCQIAKNLYFTWQKKHRRLVPLEAAPPAPIPDLAQGLDDKETAGRILTLAHQLEEPYKEVFLLHALGDVPLTQISRLFGKSESWARVTYYRARAKIAAQLEKEESL